MTSRRRDDRRSPGAQQWRKLYKGARWQRLREQQIRSHPLCERHRKKGHIVPATVVHHVDPHRGDPVKFYDPANLESVCAPCHDGETQSEERLGYSTQVGADGYPVDPRHPSNRAP
jgi:5-methylcytosine-specific restriction endonuclease McrA